jgi:hypothetical protein
MMGLITLGLVAIPGGSIWFNMLFSVIGAVDMFLAGVGFAKDYYSKRFYL